LLSSRFKLPDLARFRMPLGVLVVALIIGGLFWQQSAIKRYKQPTPYNEATAFLLDFLEQEYPDGPPAFIAFHDDLVHIPVEVHFRKKHGYRFSNLPSFITKPTLMKCAHVEACLAHYLDVLDEVDVVMINDAEQHRGTVLYDYPIADELTRTVFDRLLSEDAEFVRKAHLNTEIHGMLQVFVRQHGIRGRGGTEPLDLSTDNQVR
jgi:hypothetical protein